MKCPNCGEEVEQGNLFCPSCLEEIPWVPEYNTMETLQYQQEYTEKKRIQHMKKQLKRHVLPRRRRKAALVFFCCIFAAIAALLVLGYNSYRNYHSYGYQYHKAEEKYEDAAYDRALEHIDRAIALEQGHEEAYRLLAEILVKQRDVDGAIKVVESHLEEFPDSEILYGELLTLYECNGQPEKIKQLLDDCTSQSIRNQYASYITPDPQISHSTGTYSQEIEVKITGDCESYYYTLKKKDPSRDSRRYAGPIAIGEGTTELKVIGYNRLGIPSDIIYRKYIVALKAPEPPEILPEASYFDQPSLITIRVPEGGTCYYAFDETPDTESTKYTRPIDMPEGTHTLTAFVMGANGEQSEYVSRTYTLVY